MTGHGNRGAKHMTTKLMEAIERVSAETGDRHDIEIIRNWIERAKKNPRDLELLMAYVDGKPPQPITGADGGPIQIQGVIMSIEKAISPQPQAEKSK